MFHKMTIANKLFLGVLAFALPISVFVLFMDLSFLYDLSIARQEQTGNRYQRELYTVSSTISKYRAMELLARMNASASYPSHQDADESIAAALNSLQEIPEEDLEQIGLDARTVAEKGLAGSMPGALLAEWQAAETLSPDFLASFSQKLDTLFRHVEENSQLILDPALDSNRLADVLSRSLREFNRLMDSALSHMEMLAGLSDDPMGISHLLRDSAVLKELVIGQIIRDGSITLEEDPNFYGVCPGLEARFRPALAGFEQAAMSFSQALRERADLGAASDANLVLQWLATHEAACDLYVIGSGELDILLEKRIRSYSSWRAMGYGFGFLALAVALVVAFFMARSITRPVKNIITFADMIEHGQYHAELSGSFPGEMAGLAGNITSMVGRLKERLAFSQGILGAIVAPFLVCNRDSKITFVNPAMLSIIGAKGNPSEFLGMQLFDFFHGNGRIRELEQQCLRERICVENQEVRLADALDSPKTVSAFFSPLYDLSMDLMGICLFLFDLTELRAREEEIHAKSIEIEQLAAFPMENPSPVLASDKDGNIIYTNLAAEMVLESFRLAMKDFIPPNHKDIVTNCLQSAYSRSQVEHSARERVYSFTYNPLLSHDMVQMHVLDITERKRMEEQMVHDAFHDGLTGLPNRALFLDRLTQALSRAKAEKDHSFGVMFLDMDRFKFINDSLGHAAGDDLLIQFSKRLQLLIGPQDTLARLGGDEYTILLETVTGVSEALQLGEDIQKALTQPFIVEGHEIFTSASIGIVVDDGTYDNHADLLRDADTAMYRAKAGGKARCEVFDPDMHVSARARLEMETALNKALEQDEFCVHYQPIIHLASGRLTGFEALVRWRRSDGDLVPPGDFIPLAEETGIIDRLGIRVMDQACHTGAAWNKRFSQKLMMSVNLSVRQFTSATLREDIQKILDSSRLPSRLLKLEVTESGIMGNVEQSMKLMQSFMDMGIRLSIDDFGTGYSSLSYLHRFPFDFLKVDKSFVQALDSHGEGQKNHDIVKTIVTLARDMGKSTIAEGIENKAQLEGLRSLDCEYGQGFLFAQPMEPEEAEELIASKPLWLFEPDN